MWILIILSILVLIILLWQISNLISVIFGSLYVKTNRNVIRKALKLANVKKGNIFYDLGCGNGDVVISAAKLGAKAIGYEISPYYYILCKLRTWRFKNIKIKFQNINNVNLSKADVVYVYLLPKFLVKLAPKFKKELKPSARLISIGFPIKMVKNNTRVLFFERHLVKNHLIYVYTKKSAA